MGDRRRALVPAVWGLVCVRGRLFEEPHPTTLDVPWLTVVLARVMSTLIWLSVMTLVRLRERARRFYSKCRKAYRKRHSNIHQLQATICKLRK